MNFQDKSIQCSDCGTTFTLSAGEQEQFASRGYTNEPKRCPLCRQARKARRHSTETVATAMETITTDRCARCTMRSALIVEKTPKSPSSLPVGRPVYCSDCYRKVKVSR
jgi:hypothetical protein